MEEKARTSTKTISMAKEAGKFGKKMYGRASEAQAEGRAVVYSMALHGVSALLAAMDIPTIYGENYGTLCAYKGVNIPFIDSCRADGFPDYICSYFTNTLGCVRETTKSDGWDSPSQAPAGGMAKPSLILCVRRSRLCDVGVLSQLAFKRYVDVPAYCLDLHHPPAYLEHNEEERSSYLRYAVEQFKDFTRVLEELTGRKLDMDRLCQCVELETESRRLWHEVYELRKAIPCPMVSADAWSCMVPFYWMPAERETLEFYQKLYDEVKYRVDNKIGAIPHERYRAMFTEGALWFSLPFFDRLAELGIALAIEGHWYYAGWDPEVTRISDPYERMARNHLADHWEWIVRARSGAGDEAVQQYMEWVRDYKLDGAIICLLTTCHGATYHFLHAWNVFREHNIPSLIIEADLTDPRGTDMDEILRRTDVFAGVLEAHKRGIKEGK